MSNQTKEILSRWSSRQFIITLNVLYLATWITMEGKDLTAITALGLAAIGGAAGLNIQQARKNNDQN